MPFARDKTLSDVLDTIGAPGDACRRLPSRNEVWVVDHDVGRVVLRRQTTSASLDDVEWIHSFLAQLDASQVRTPKPAPIFGGRSCGVVGGEVWEALTYVPGTTVGWSRRPSLRELGAFLARFHGAAAAGGRLDQRPTCIEVAALPVAAATVDALVPMIATLECDLDSIGHDHAERGVVHGDFTAHNVLGGGDPIAPVGVIDFGNAYVEATLADIAFGLWRSGRPSQRAQTFDVRRVAAFVGGYASLRPLAPAAAEAIVVYLRARGIQIVVKQARRGVVDVGPLTKLAWLDENRDALQRGIEVALTST